MPPIRALPRIFAILVAASLVAPLAIACGGEEEDELKSAVAEIAAADEMRPESRGEARAALVAARDRLAAQAADVDAASAEVEAARAGLEAAESRLEVARGAYEEYQREVKSYAEQMREFAVPDPLLFRNVQRELLDASALRGVAIAAEVSEGVVSLRGRVPDEATRAAAVALVGSLDGVISVDDRIEVAAAD